MSAQQVTISLPAELARYVDAAPDAGSLVADALRLYRERALARELAQAYREDAEESLELHLDNASIGVVVDVAGESTAVVADLERAAGGVVVHFLDLILRRRYVGTVLSADLKLEAARSIVPDPLVDVDAADLAMLLGSWGACPPAADCPADYDADGQVTAADLALLLGDWD